MNMQETKYHRHVLGILPFTEAIDRLVNDLPQAYRYCPICKCVPTSIFARDPVEEGLSQ